jgi:hypothetical protein
MLILWMVIAAVLSIRAFSRPSYAVGFYMLTFFGHPFFWWWGDMLRGYRWNLYAGLLLLGTLVISRSDQAFEPESPLRTKSAQVLAFMVVNILAVHLFFAVNPDSSMAWVISRLKFILLFFVLQYAVRDEKDYRNVAWAIALGIGYIGYEATINERGHFSGGRLEGIGAAGVTSSNQLASLLITALPIASTLLFVQLKKWQKVALIILCAWTFNVVLMCNSRGAFLGLLLGGVVFLVLASGPARKRSLQLGGLALLGAILLLRDPEIVTRFMTTFNDEGERDHSAESRLFFWTAGMKMVASYPLGSGGNSFSEGRGWRFMPNTAASEADDRAGNTRALHNGFITELTDWGIQGFAMMLLFIGTMWTAILSGRSRALKAGDANSVMVFALLGAGVAGWMVSSVFGDYLNDEWGFWIAAMPYAYMRAREAVLASGAVASSELPVAAPVVTLSPAVPRTLAR